MVLMMVAGSAGSGRTGIMGSNAVTQAMQGKKVMILSSEHKDLEPYLRLTEYSKEDLGSGSIKLVYTGMESAKDVIDTYPKSELPEVMILDTHFNRESSMQDAVEIHALLSKRYVHPLVCVNVQTNRGYPLGSGSIVL